ncbi:hypothetical protein BRADI_4g16271v3 [Brachypodium distachyon]|uniref:Uncharacterized protein n=1 Tax=Brachypodium distachyon TaxID=15368 RepID=A0A2K2CN70_BRADI|nr:hypothetical protein BRADI_4g16271v3 [Brachypodium distachyon]
MLAFIAEMIAITEEGTSQSISCWWGTGKSNKVLHVSALQLYRICGKTYFFRRDVSRDEGDWSKMIGVSTEWKGLCTGSQPCLLDRFCAVGKYGIRIAAHSLDNVMMEKLALQSRGDNLQKLN